MRFLGIFAKIVTIMSQKTILQQLDELRSLVEGWEENVPLIERDLALRRLMELYEQIRFPESQMESASHQPLTLEEMDREDEEPEVEVELVYPQEDDEEFSEETQQEEREENSESEGEDEAEEPEALDTLDMDGLSEIEILNLEETASAEDDAATSQEQIAQSSEPEIEVLNQDSEMIEPAASEEEAEQDEDLFIEEIYPEPQQEPLEEPQWEPVQKEMFEVPQTEVPVDLESAAADELPPLDVPLRQSFVQQTGTEQSLFGDIPLPKAQPTRQAAIRSLYDDDDDILSLRPHQKPAGPIMGDENPQTQYVSVVCEEDAPEQSETEQQPQTVSASHEGQVLGETIQTPQTLGEILQRQALRNASMKVASLRAAISVADRYQIVKELFNSNADNYEACINDLDNMQTMEDCMIYITENYSWNVETESAKLLVSLIERKFQ